MKAQMQSSKDRNDQSFEAVDTKQVQSTLSARSFKTKITSVCTSNPDSVTDQCYPLIRISAKQNKMVHDLQLSVVHNFTGNDWARCV